MRVITLYCQIKIEIIRTFIFDGPLKDDCVSKWPAKEKRFDITDLDDILQITTSVDNFLKLNYKETLETRKFIIYIDYYKGV